MYNVLRKVQAFRGFCKEVKALKWLTVVAPLSIVAMVTGACRAPFQYVNTTGREYPL